MTILQIWSFLQVKIIVICLFENKLANPYCVFLLFYLLTSEAKKAFPIIGRHVMALAINIILSFILHHTYFPYYYTFWLLILFSFLIDCYPLFLLHHLFNTLVRSSFTLNSSYHTFIICHLTVPPEIVLPVIASQSERVTCLTPFRSNQPWKVLNIIFIKFSFICYWETVVR
jgi:hypothetical protein